MGIKIINHTKPTTPAPTTKPWQWHADQREAEQAHAKQVQDAQRRFRTASQFHKLFSGNK